MTPLEYIHVDVFSSTPYGGNSLPVFYDGPELAAAAMLRITRELRHFEAIFLHADLGARTARARIFDLIEELPFAGHPLIGAAAALQHLSAPRGCGVWTFDLAGRIARVEVEARETGYFGVLDQGAPRFLGEVRDRAAIARAFTLAPDDLDPKLPLEAASTGLRYLVVPLRPDRIGAARIGADITGLLAAHGAQFAVLFDPSTFEIRHWNNDGVLEDVATGSAAGVVGAYALKHGLVVAGRRFTLSQGRFAGRPSRLEVQADTAGGEIASVKVGGPVAIVGRGRLDALPEDAG
jgi:trans-2,3-dihydro-3-hydroxyanthranilate isomerase